MPKMNRPASKRNKPEMAKKPKGKSNPKKRKTTGY